MGPEPEYFFFLLQQLKLVMNMNHSDRSRLYLQRFVKFYDLCMYFAISLCSQSAVRTLFERLAVAYQIYNLVCSQ